MIAAGYEITIQGFVQGQGVRPALARLAGEQRWGGSVRNLPQGVLLKLYETAIDPRELETRIRNAHLALEFAAISIHACPSVTGEGFQILDSETEGILSVSVPRDVSVCRDCLQEYHTPTNRRHRFGLASCIRCGPRFSIVESMPFDRQRTTLRTFPLCSACQSEYNSPCDRRSHAQTIGCPQCGPRIWATDRNGVQHAEGDAACQLVANVLLHGGIVALRGIGGYQLLFDATNDDAVAELRRRKRRASKPLAVMCRTLGEADSLAIIDAAAREALVSPANPIVIVPRRFERTLAAGVHPQLAEIGLLLPTTAVHDRLLELVERPLVCTSGNAEGAPLAVDASEAVNQLANMADLWLHHDRPIAQPVDDSVVRPMAGRMVTLRCARGLAPLPLDLPAPSPLIALGGFQKSAVAWSNGGQAVLGPHVGDLHELQTRERWSATLNRMSTLYGVTDATWVVDGHPDDCARRAVPDGARVMTAWHHHAHIVAGMLEHGWLDRTVVGFAGDGQGYGPDGQLWGGEVLWATAASFRRLARVRPFALIGGELAVHEPARVAAAMLSQLPDADAVRSAECLRCDAARIRTWLSAVRARVTPWTSSLGRLFDGVATLVLGIERASYIGEPAVRCEAACDPAAAGSYAWTIHTDTVPWELDWRPMLGALLQDLRRGESAGAMAERFHRSLVHCILELQSLCPPCPLVVSGGVFQNRRLCELLAERWSPDRPPIGLPGVIPPNDGGLAAGQLAIAAARLAALRMDLRRENQENS